MEFILIIIAVVIVSVISAALKKKPRSTGDQQDAPARPTMTDIQRAFMMAAGLPENEQDQPNQPPSVPYVRPAPGSYTPYTPHPSPYAPPVAPYTQSESSQYTAPPMTESYSGLSKDSELKSRSVESAHPYAGAQVSSYFMDEADAEQLSPAMPAHQQARADAPQIALFEDRRDIIKAVIYSEILSRKSSAHRLK